MALRTLWGFVGAGLVLLIACGGSDANVPTDDGGVGADGSNTSGGPGSEGGTSNDGSTPTDSSTPVDAPTGGICQMDADCNESASASAGTCYKGAGATSGVCICKLTFHVQPNGKCAATAPPDCQTQGGQCVQGTAACPAGSIEGSADDNRTCGDLIAAACCFDLLKCKGPSFTCCGPTNQARPQICENGHLTCQPGDHAVATGTICG